MKQIEFVWNSRLIIERYMEVLGYIYMEGGDGEAKGNS
jgi:hypothetical protein